MLIGAGPQRPSKLDDLLDPGLAARLTRLDYRTRRIFAGKLQGERRSKRRGQSVEFDDYRDYVPGDDLRFIDWNVYARFDRLFIKLFLEEEDLSVHIAVDASPSMHAGAPPKLLHAARIAMALGAVGLAGNNRVGMTIFGGAAAASTAERAPAPDEPGAPDRAPGSALLRLPELRGSHHIPRLGRFLLEGLWPDAARAPADVSRRGDPALARAFSDALTAIARGRTGKGVMILLSDFLTHPEEPAADPFDQPGYQRGLRALAAAGGYDTICLQILSPSEIEPERDVQQGITGDMRLVDVETGHAAEVTVTAQLLKLYKQRLERYCAQLHAFCIARRMTHLLVRTDEPVDQLVLHTLRRLGVVG
ncbi:MAG: DUF58 domain-containing protein [Planctomycetota bacterium]|nr:DUF58 domain-containing protein [Planctomycetota bacterium]